MVVDAGVSAAVELAGIGAEGTDEEEASAVEAVWEVVSSEGVSFEESTVEPEMRETACFPERRSSPRS
jgi:hypothetical protein